MPTFFLKYQCFVVSELVNQVIQKIKNLQLHLSQESIYTYMYVTT